MPCPNISSLGAKCLTFSCYPQDTPSPSVAQTTEGPSSTGIPASSSGIENRSLGNTIAPSDNEGVFEKKPPEPTVLEQTPAKSSLWTLAYECFQREDPKLARKFSDCLGLDHTEINAGLNQVIQKALEKISEAQDSKDKLYKTPLGRYLKKAVEIIIASKDFIGSAVSAEPHAALAWCGVSLLLPVSLLDYSPHILMMQKLLLNPYQENEASQKGLADVLTLMTVYEWQEKTYLQHDNARSSLKDSLTGLYTMMLSYQAALLVHLGGNSPKQWMDSIVNAGDWSSRLKDIRDQEAKCRLISTAIDCYLRAKWHEEEIKWQQDLLQQPRLAEESSHLRKLHSNYEAGKNVNPERVPGTCHWFLDHVDFLTWRKSQSSRLLWLSADPGCGKSVLAKYLVDRKGEVLSVHNTGPTVCYFFFKDGDVERRDGAKAVCALLHQLFLQQPRLYLHAKEDFRTKSESFLTDLDTTWNIFMKACEDFSEAEIICVLDALDECREDSRKVLVKKLVQFYSRQQAVHDQRPMVKFLVTSRPEFSIIRDFRDLTEVRLRGEEESEQISREIDLVIEKRVQEIRRTMDLSLPQQLSLQKNLTSIPQRTYLWLHLTLDAIEKKLMLTEKDIAVIVSNIPKNVNEAYTAILDKSWDKDMARKLLHIILAAKRPLSLEEVNVAMVIDKFHEYYDALEMWSPVGSADLVKNICGLFISVVDSKVYLIHQTAREFLLGEEQRGWRKSFRLAESNLILAKACIWLLVLRDFEENDLRPIDERSGRPSESGSNHSVTSAESQPGNEDASSLKSAENATLNDQETRIEPSSDEQVEEEATQHNQTDEDASSTDAETTHQTNTDGQSVVDLLSNDDDSLDQGHYCFYQYAYSYWKDHFIEAANLPESALMATVAYRLCDANLRCSRNWIFWFSEFKDFDDFPSPSSTNLAVASHLGLSAIVKLLLDSGSNVDSKNELRRTPMHEAASEGHRTVVELLFEHGAEINSTDHEGYTPLHDAASMDHEKVANLLLNWGAEVDAVNHQKETPLHRAAECDSEEIVNLLVARGAHVDHMNDKGQTPLVLAIKSSNESICRLLLEAGARTDIIDKGGKTLLHHAAGGGQEAIVQIFLDRGIEVNSQDHKGRTAIFSAAVKGKSAAVKLLLNAGARTDIRDNYGKTLLHYAAVSRREEVVQIFLDLGLELNSQDHSGRTALFDMAAERNPAAVKLLLERGARTDLKDEEGRTPYSIAEENKEHPLIFVSSKGYNEVLKLLRENDSSE